MFLLKEQEKNLYQHIADIRRLLLIFAAYFAITITVVLIYSFNIYQWFEYPLAATLKLTGYKAQIIATRLPESFFAYLKMSFYVSLIICLPILYIQIVAYVYPALINVKYTISRFKLLLITILGPLLFYFGCTVAYFSSIKMAFIFFIKFSDSRNISLYLKISNYIDLVLSMVVWIGVSFDLPVIVLILYLIGLINFKFLKKTRKAFIVVAFIIAAIITPPDPLSQIVLAIIMILLYEVSLLLIYLAFERHSIISISKNHDRY